MERELMREARISSRVRTELGKNRRHGRPFFREKYAWGQLFEIGRAKHQRLLNPGLEELVKDHPEVENCIHGCENMKGSNEHYQTGECVGMGARKEDLLETILISSHPPL